MALTMSMFLGRRCHRQYSITTATTTNNDDDDDDSDGDDYSELREESLLAR